MGKPNLRAVDSEVDHLRDSTRCKIKQWRSNAEREKWAIANQHDDKGAKVLDVDAALKWEPKHLGRK